MIMETKLAEYRARKMRETQHLSENQPDPTSAKASLENMPLTVNSSKKEIQDPCQPNGNVDHARESKPISAFDRKLDIALVIVEVAIWCLLMALFVHLEFGAVFFVFSVFYVMCRNFRTTPKTPGEVSAYSVFNPNCENIEGTLTAAQFERELTFRQI